MKPRSRHRVLVFGLVGAVALLAVASLWIVMRAWSTACCAYSPAMLFDGAIDESDAR